MRASLVRLLDVARTLGWRRAARIGAGWLVHREYLVLVRDLRGSLPPPPRLPELGWTALGEDDLASVRALSLPLPGREARRRLREGQECVVAWLDGRPVYARWETTRPARLPYLGRRFRPLPGDLLVVDEYTIPALRGRGIATAGSTAALLRAHARGLTRSIALVAPWNLPALRVTRDQLGRRVVGTVGYRPGSSGRAYFVTGAARLDEAGDIYVVAG